MRWEGVILAITLTAAETAQAGDIVKTYSDTFSDAIMRSLASGKGTTAKGAQAYLKRRELEEKEANRGPRRTVAECMKPGNVIDDDVNECVKGYREKTW